jgi:hypothetical protein
MCGLRCHRCAHRDPERLLSRDLILIDLFLAGRMTFDRLVARFDFADFNRAAANSISGDAISATVTTALTIPPTRSQWRLPAIIRI